MDWNSEIFFLLYSQYLIFDGKNVTVEYIGNKMLIEYQVM